MALSVFFKDPDATLDYRMDWSAWLGTDTIASALWTIPTGITSALQTNTTTTATVRLSGGTASSMYTVTCTILTVSGQQDQRSIVLVLQD